MRAVVTKKNSSKELSKEQRKFNTLKTRLENLQEKIDISGKLYDQALEFFASDVYPQQIKYLRSMEEVVVVLYAIHKNPPKLSKKKKEDLKDVIIMRAMTALDFAPHELIAPETFVILKDLEAYNDDEVVEEEDNGMRSKLQDFLNTSKHNVDLSEIDFNGTREEILGHFAELLAEADKKQESQNEQFYERAQESKKTKKQRIKEQKEEELASLQKKGLSSVYKQLAKTLHPDLEQNQEVKAEKEVLMKKLTSAYKNNDLHSILTLEIEWMEKSGNSEVKASSDEQLKVYNSILKDQVNDLERTLAELCYDPKYSPIAQYCRDPYMSPKNVMTLSLKKLKSETKFNNETVNALLSPQAEHVLKAILDSYATFY